MTMPSNPELDALLAEVQLNVERWIAAVTTDGSMSGAAAQGCRNEINRLRAAIDAARKET